MHFYLWCFYRDFPSIFHFMHFYRDVSICYSIINFQTCVLKLHYAGLGLCLHRRRWRIVYTGELSFRIRSRLSLFTLHSPWQLGRYIMFSGANIAPPTAGKVYRTSFSYLLWTSPAVHLCFYPQFIYRCFFINFLAVCRLLGFYIPVSSHNLLF